MRTEPSGDTGTGTAEAIIIAPKPAGSTRSRRARVNPGRRPGFTRGYERLPHGEVVRQAVAVRRDHHVGRLHGPA